jgi:protein-tyrosine kinase
MSRIEEALRRVGRESDTSSAPSHQQSTFTSPWSFGEEEPRASLQPVPASDLVPADEERTDTRMIDDARPILALSTGIKSAELERLVVAPSVHPALSEEYRRLAAALHHAQLGNGIRIVLVSSAVAEEGKSLVATNLALTLSESYRRQVLLVDADLRRPSLHKIFSVPNVQGLNEGLKAERNNRLTLLQLTQSLTLLPAGRPDPNPLAGLSSPRMRQILAEAAARFDWIVVDTPPVAILADANILAEMADATLLVIKAGSTPCSLVEKAISAVGRERLMGVVLNDVRESPVDAHYYGYGHHREDGAPAR